MSIILHAFPFSRFAKAKLKSIFWNEISKFLFCLWNRIKISFGKSFFLFVLIRVFVKWSANRGIHTVKSRSRKCIKIPAYLSKIRAFAGTNRVWIDSKNFATKRVHSTIFLSFYSCLFDYIEVLSTKYRVKVTLSNDRNFIIRNLKSIYLS